jgi:hypothetical protein
MNRAFSRLSPEEIIADPQTVFDMIVDENLDYLYLSSLYEN